MKKNLVKYLETENFQFRSNANRVRQIQIKKILSQFQSVKRQVRSIESLEKSKF